MATDPALAAPPVGRTPRDLIEARGTMALYHYRPLAAELYRVPLLLVMPPTNRGYIFDLAPGNSLVEFLLQGGFDVYMLDWNPPRADEHDLGLDAYVTDFVAGAMARVRADSGEARVTLVGYCMGGVLALLYAALHPDDGPSSLACFTTPADFTQMGPLSALTDNPSFDAAAIVDAGGNVPVDIIYATFNLMQPIARLLGTMRLGDNLADAEFVRSYRLIDRWSADLLPLAGRFFHDITRLMRAGPLARGLVVDGCTIDLAAITVPFLHVLAEHDQIVPYAASSPLLTQIGSPDRQEIILKGGHVSVLAGTSASARLWPYFDRWLQPHSV